MVYVFKGVVVSLLVILVIFCLLFNFVESRKERKLVFRLNARRRISQILFFVLKWCQTWYFKLKREDKPDGDTLIPLTPINTAENIEQYEKELTAAIVNPVVHNIALAGSYGSGKSSIIKTFFQNNPGFRPIFISLAAFKDEIEEPVEDGEGTDAAHIEQGKINKRIEFSILQQLFYHVKSKAIPYSRFKQIRPISKSIAGVIAIPIFLLAISALYFKLKDWKPLVDLTDCKWPYISTFDLYGMIILILGLFWGIYYLVKIMRLGIIKLNLQGTEVEISKETNVSILNKHIDEILYFFSSTKFDVLVIEDLDRFKNEEIFVKLREINTLINNSKQVGRKISFLYALRDDVFVDEKRTKFFDLIIPVVPVINASNSASDLIELFGKLKLDPPIPDSFLSDLAIFITDRRLILNIFNEFKIYYAQLSKGDLDNVRLLSLIVYKNIKPTDFSLLQENKGILYELFQKKEELSSELSTVLKKNIEKIEAQLKEIDSNIFSSQRQLRMIYVAACFQLVNEKFSYHNLGKLVINGSNWNFKDLLSDNVFDQLMKSSAINAWDNNYGERISNIGFKDAENLVDSDQPYLVKERQMMTVLLYDKRQLLQQLNDSKRDFSRIQGKTFHELLQLKHLSSIDTPIKDDPRLVFLINQGYIQEDYNYYLSYFKPGQLSHNDIAFILAVKQGQESAWDHQLDKVAIVADRITETECLSWEVMNFELLAHLLGRNVYPLKLEGMVGQLASLDLEAGGFIDDFRREYPQSIGRLITELISYTDKFWGFIVHEGHFQPEEIVQYFYSMMLSGKLDAIKKQDNDRELSDYIANNCFFFNTDNQEFVQTLLNVIKDLSIFIAVSPIAPSYSLTVRDFIYDNNLYEINKVMVEFMLTSSNAIDDLAVFNQGQFSNILNTPALEKLGAYLTENIDKYVDNVYLAYDNHEDENIQSVLFILNSDKVSPASKEKVIATTKFQIVELTDVSKELWNLLLEHNRLNPKWANINTYQKQLGISKELTAWIERSEVYSQLMTDVIPAQAAEEDVLVNEYRQVIKHVLENANISQHVKGNLIAAVAFKFDNFDFDTLSPEVANALIPKLAFSVEMANYLINKSPDLFTSYVKLNWPEFINKYTRISLTDGIISSILKSDIGDEMKLDLYKMLSPTSVPALLKDGVEIPDEVFNYENMSFSGEEILEFLGQIGEDYIVQMLIANIGAIDLEVIKNILRRLGGGYEKIGKRVGREVNKTDRMLQLVKVLEEKGLIISRKIEKPKTIEIFYDEEEKEEEE